MEDNIVHAISLFGATILFLVAFSCAIVAYNGLTDRVDDFFALNSITGQREDATTVDMDRAEVKRKVSFEEVYLAILNMPKYVSTDGNAIGSEIRIGTNTYTATFDIDTNIQTIKLSGTYNKEYIVGKQTDMQNMLKDFCTITIGVNPSGKSNDVFRNNKDLINSVTFSIHYDKDSITYIKN